MLPVVAAQEMGVKIFFRETENTKYLQILM
jgi:hypothetical protein